MMTFADVETPQLLAEIGANDTVNFRRRRMIRRNLIKLVCLLCWKGKVQNVIAF